MSRKIKLVLIIILILVLLLFGTYKLMKSRVFQISGDLIHKVDAEGKSYLFNF